MCESIVLLFHFIIDISGFLLFHRVAFFVVVDGGGVGNNPARVLGLSGMSGNFHRRLEIWM